MERTCARAQTVGLPALAFTEHLDFTPWIVDPDDYREDARRLGRAPGDRRNTPVIPLGGPHR